MTERLLFGGKLAAVFRQVRPIELLAASSRHATEAVTQRERWFCQTEGPSRGSFVPSPRSALRRISADPEAIPLGPTE